MKTLTRLYDLRSANKKWELLTETLGNELITPDGEVLFAISLPGASLCADFLVVPETRVWAGITIAIHERDFEVIKCFLEKATNPITKLIPVGDGEKLARYRGFPDWGWFEINWLDEPNVEISPALTNQVLWYANKCQKSQKAKIVLLALENLKQLLKEGPDGMILPKL